MQILIASTNIGKLREIQAVLHGYPFSLCLPSEIGLDLEVVEDGKNYTENAVIKARAYARASGLLSLADDSGLEVDLLAGAPGLYSARYHPRPAASDSDRRAYLLENLAGFPRPWLAHFHCTVAIANPQGQVWLSEGDCAGEIIPQERGNSGFGYDPIFLLPQMGRTMAELNIDEKNQLSHRALALRSALPALHKLADSLRK